VLLSKACAKTVVLTSLLVVSSALTSGCGPTVKNGPRVTSFENLRKIGFAIRAYADGHGVLPQSFSNLVPVYIPLDKIGVFYVTNGYAKEMPIPADWPSNPSIVDQYSSYIYLGTNNLHGVLAYEKVELWKPTASYHGQIAVLFTDFHVQYLATAKLEELVPTKVPSPR
jgi:hypothetical protein